MAGQRKCLQKYQYNGPENSFLASIWWYLRISQVLGHIPLRLSSTKHECKIRDSKFISTYYLALFIMLAILTVYSHLTMPHDHHNHRNPMIHHMAIFQLVVISITAAIGAINTFVMRVKLAKVNIGVVNLFIVTYDATVCGRGVKDFVKLWYRWRWGGGQEKVLLNM